MKFLCDRCKTRYSIGDDRVRGKILKIRCKNCANVITVREGMEAQAVEDGATTADGAVGRPKKSTTQAPPVEAASAATATAAPASPGRNALGAAFASAMSNPAAKPPSSLEEEWYVSIDGDQSGPFSLAEAQRWVAGRAWDAELHCWSEGFDDWLPVDKVSHFRGLRKKPPAPMTPPPLPRGGGSGPQARIATVATPAVVEEEPKPLFAATMASLEKSAAQALPPGNLRATPPGGVPGVPALKPRAIPTPANGSNGSGAGSVAAVAKVAPRAGGFGGAKKIPGFDLDIADSATQITSPPFTDEAPEPRAAKVKPPVSLAALAQPQPQPQPQLTPAAESFADEPEGEDDLDIGEVSRVVNLADLVRNGPGAKKPRTNPSQAVPVGLAPLIGRVSGVNQAIGGNSTGGIARVDLNTGLPIAPLAPGVDPTSLSPLDPNYVPDMAMQPQPVTPQATNNRMALMLGIGVTALVGIVVAVVLVVNRGDDTTFGGLHNGPDYSTERPEDTIKKTSGQDPNPAGSGATTANPQNPFLRPQQHPHPNTNPIPVPDTHGLPDPAEEIEDLANKNSGLTSRCFLRASKGVNAITVGDVKKIIVIMSVDASGTVTTVSLSDGHQADALGQCLVPVIKGWKFKPNKGGTVKLTMAAPHS